MRKMFYLTLSVFILLGAFIFTGNVLAAEDNTAPTLESFDISPVEINTSDDDQVVVLTMRVKDDLSGVGYYSIDHSGQGSMQVDFTPLIGTQRVSAIWDFTMISGDANDGIYQHDITIPKWAKSGVWVVDFIVLIDELGNERFIYTDELNEMLPNSNITFSNTQSDTSVKIEREWILSNTNTATTVTFPENTTVTRSDEGSFQFYQMVNKKFDVSSLSNNNLAGGVIESIQFGIPGLNLSFDKAVTVKMNVGTQHIGETLLIQSFKEGANEWATERTCTVEFEGPLDEYGENNLNDSSSKGWCTFTVDHATYFAAVEAPVRAIITGTKTGGGPEVRAYDVSGKMLSYFNAYENTWWGGINVAVGDINGDGTKEIITSTRGGGIPTIRVFDINGNNLGWDFDAYTAGFRGGISLAVGDIEGDGMDEIVVAAMSGGGPNIRTFGYRNGEIVSVTENFMAYDENFRGGISISIGDLEGDGIGEIITTPISGGGPHVRVFGSRNGVFVPVTLGVMAYAENFHGGITTCTADLNGNGKDEVVTGIFSAGGPHVRAIGIGSNGELALSNPGFMAFSSNFRGGVSVAALDTNGNGVEEIITAVGGQDVGHIKIMSSDGTLLSPSFQAYGSGYHGGVTIAAGVF